MFYTKNPYFWGAGVKLLVPLYQGTNETPLSCWKHWPVRLQLAARDENVQFWPESLDIRGWKSIFWDCDFVKGAYHQHTRGYNFPIQTTPKKNCISQLWVHFRGSTRFWAILGLCHFASISTLNFGPWSGPSKKRPTMKTDLVPAGIREKRPYLRLAKKCFFS